MSITPGYGETPVADDELDALLPAARELLDEPITRAAVYDLEQAVQDDVAEAMLSAGISGELGLDDVLSDYFLRDLPTSCVTCLLLA